MTAKGVRLAGLALAAVLLAGSPARADQGGATRPAAHEKAGTAPGGGKATAPKWGDGRATTDPAEQPARGAPYNWRQMGFGAIVMALMLAFVIWLVRRETRGR
jgi:hypothetical protein